MMQLVFFTMFVSDYCFLIWKFPVVPPAQMPKSGGTKMFCSLRSQKLRPHFQKRGAALGFDIEFTADARGSADLMYRI